MEYLMEVHGWEFGKGSFSLPIPYSGLVLSIYPEHTFNALDKATGKIVQYNSPQGQRLHCAVQLDKINIRYINIHTEEEFYELMISYQYYKDAVDEYKEMQKTL